MVDNANNNNIVGALALQSLYMQISKKCKSQCYLHNLWLEIYTSRKKLKIKYDPKLM